MKSVDMICQNCDYFEPWDTDSPLFVHFRSTDGYNNSWSLEMNGSCRRYPPNVEAGLQNPDSLPCYPMFPPVSAAYWCGEGRWTDFESGNRFYWGDWDE